MELYTDRLFLRPWREEDAGALYALAKDPRVGDPAGWPAHGSRQESLEIIRSVLTKLEIYAICRKADNRLIGCITLKMGADTDLTQQPDEAEIGYWLGVPFWGQGFMPEAVCVLQRHAFEDLGMQTLWCGYYDGNDKSRRVQEKCGFRYHHTTQNVEVPRLNTVRTGHVTRMTAMEWKEKNHAN